MMYLVAGEKGLPRYQAPCRVNRVVAHGAVQDSWQGTDKASDLVRLARIQDLLLVYVPFWRLRAQLVGWRFGQTGSGDDSRPVEVLVTEQVHWSSAACDGTELGVPRVPIADTDLSAFDSDALHAEGMVFEPTMSHSVALEQARLALIAQGRTKGKLNRSFYQHFDLVQERLSLVFYPLWVGRYSFKGRTYQVVVDGLRGNVLYGAAPGNLLYRAAMLVFGMALGTALLVNLPLSALYSYVSQLRSVKFDEICFGLFLLAWLMELGRRFVQGAYTVFRDGEQVEVGEFKSDDPLRRLFGLRPSVRRGGS
jgi:hypothetical protein